MTKPLSLEEQASHRFWPHVSGREGDGCWPWVGKRSADGYGYLSFGGRSMNAHRASAIIHGLPVKPRLHVDHICRNRACVNPAHLRVVTAAENTLAEGSEAPTAINARKTHCKRGHPLTPDNLTGRSKTTGWRVCAECVRTWRSRVPKPTTPQGIAAAMSEPQRRVLLDLPGRIGRCRGRAGKALTAKGLILPCHRYVYRHIVTPLGREVQAALKETLSPNTDGGDHAGR